MRFYDVQKGRILLDGVDVRDWDLHDLRSNFAVVLQDVFLFSGSIEEQYPAWQRGNYRRDGSSGRRRRFTRTNLSKLDEGYESEVSERGAGLSVGQKQLISFARALGVRPDDSDSGRSDELDRHRDRAADPAGRRTRDGGPDSLVVAHRLSTIQKCDRIMVFHHGELREGGHASTNFLNLRGLYWRLYQLQYADEKLHSSAAPAGESEFNSKPASAADQVLKNRSFTKG